MANKEFDVSPIAWEAYKLMYRENFDEDEFAILDHRTRQYIKGAFKFGDQRTDPMFFSGETDFNFGAGFAHNTFSKYKKFLSNEESPDREYAARYGKHLELCEQLFYSIANISIMPQTGALQLAKKGIGNDRLDTFIWALDAYYEKESNLLLNHSSQENLPLLNEFLSLFGNVYEYCQTIYHISESLVDDCINSGKREIDCPERVMEYMNLALRFWRQKIAFLKSQDGKSEAIETELTQIEEKLDSFFSWSQ